MLAEMLRRAVRRFDFAFRQQAPRWFFCLQPRQCSNCAAKQAERREAGKAANKKIVTGCELNTLLPPQKVQGTRSASI